MCAPEGAALKNRLLKEMGGRQCANGSWDGTVSATVHHLEILAECGLAETKQFARGIAYLFECLQPELRRRDCVVAHDMISSPDCKAEFQSTLMYHPDWIPHPACHSHLPVIQTGYALRLLNKVGYENDKRVKAACQNMVDLHDRFGGWCCTNIRIGLNAEAAESRQRQAPVPKPLPRTRK